jgi:hypothetical protein
MSYSPPALISGHWGREARWQRLMAQASIDDLCNHVAEGGTLLEFAWPWRVSVLDLYDWVEHLGESDQQRFAAAQRVSSRSHAERALLATRDPDIPPAMATAHARVRLWMAERLRGGEFATRPPEQPTGQPGDSLHEQTQISGEQLERASLAWLQSRGYEIGGT